MNCSLRVVVMSILIVNVLSCFGQEKGRTTFSIGGRLAMGVTPTPMKATFTSSGAVTAIKPTLHYSSGLIFQYMIGNLFGLETGAQMNHYNYSTSGFKIGGEPEDHAIIDFQVPLLFSLRLEHRYNIFRSYKILAGTSIDWLATKNLTALAPTPWLKNVILEFRIGSDKIKYGRIEYGIQYQYSLSRFRFNAVDYNIPDSYFNARLNYLSINFYFFFINKKFSNSEVGI